MLGGRAEPWWRNHGAGCNLNGNEQATSPRSCDQLAIGARSKDAGVPARHIGRRFERTSRDALDGADSMVRSRADPVRLHADALFEPGEASLDAIQSFATGCADLHRDRDEAIQAFVYAVKTFVDRPQQTAERLTMIRFKRFADVCLIVGMRLPAFAVCLARFRIHDARLTPDHGLGQLDALTG